MKVIPISDTNFSDSCTEVTYSIVNLRFKSIVQSFVIVREFSYKNAQIQYQFQYKIIGKSSTQFVVIKQG